MPTEPVGHSDFYVSPLLRAAGGLAKKAAVSGASYMASVAHPRYNAVLDAGAFDGTDYTMPAFRAGYSVFTFEMAPDNQNRVLSTLNANGLHEGPDYTIIRPVPGAQPSPPARAAKQAHIYLFFAGVSSANGGVRFRFNSVMSGAGEGVEVAGVCSGAGDPACVPVVRIDDVVPSWAQLWIFKLDVQGHEPQALAGAASLLASRRVHSLMMEWWPAGMIQQGTADGGIAALESLYALGVCCYDAATTETNQMPGTGIDHATSVPARTAAMLAVPRRTPPGGDPIGAWDDLMCTMPLEPPLPSGARGPFISPLLRAAGGLAKKAGVSGVSYMASVAHPRYNAVLDAGAFDGSDYTLPAFRAGYSVFSFEMAPENQNRVVATLMGAGLREGADYTVIRPTPGARPSPPARAAAQAHIYLFFAGVSSSNSGVKVGYNSIMNGAGEGIEVAGPCSGAGDASCSPVVRIDDVIPDWAQLWIFKLDVQGHEPQALAGAAALLASRRVHSLMMEWWPAGMMEQGTADGGVAALNALYALGAQCFDVGTSEGNQMPGTGIDHVTSVPAWTAAMLAVPRHTPPGGDPIGAWDDLMCTMPLE